MAVPEKQRADRPLVIGLLGGIAAGKSTVATLFAEHGFAVVDADREAREAVLDPAIAQRLRQRFGAAIFDPSGALDRARMARLVFDDPAARQDLQAITHPAIRRAIVAAMDSARAAGQDVVLDVPLLLEGGLIEACDHAVFIEASLAQRRNRARGRGWADDELERREGHQASLDAKRARCAHTVRNDGDLEATRAQVLAIVSDL